MGELLIVDWGWKGHRKCSMNIWGQEFNQDSHTYWPVSPCYLLGLRTCPLTPEFQEVATVQNPPWGHLSLRPSTRKGTGRNGGLGFKALRTGMRVWSMPHHPAELGLASRRGFLRQPCKPVERGARGCRIESSLSNFPWLPDQGSGYRVPSIRFPYSLLNSKEETQHRARQVSCPRVASPFSRLLPPSSESLLQ